MKKFVTFGETLAQYNATYVGPFREDGTYLLDCAGAESNVAVDLKKLGLADVETVWISRVGDDEAGDFVLKELNGRTTVSTRRLAGQKTGISYLNHLGDGESVKAYRRKDSAASRLTFAEVEPHLTDADVLHVTGITPALSDTCRDTIFAAMDYARGHDIPVSFDLNYRPQLWEPAEARGIFEAMVARSSLFKLGHDEAETVWGRGWLAERYAEHFHRLSGGLVVVTCGNRGAVAVDGANRVDHQGYDVEVVDPVGAGDAVVAGFLGGVLRDHTFAAFIRLYDAARRQVIEGSLEVANVCGALTCTRHGDTAAMPTMAEVREFLSGQ